MEPDPQDCWPRRKSFAKPLKLEDSTVMAEWVVRLELTRPQSMQLQLG